MGENDDASRLQAGLNRALGRAGLGGAGGLVRLTGGATMESWRFSAEGQNFVLRCAPSLAMMEDRPFGHTTEAAIIRAVKAPIRPMGMIRLRAMGTVICDCMNLLSAMPSKVSCAGWSSALKSG